MRTRLAASTYSMKVRQSTASSRTINCSGVLSSVLAIYGVWASAKAVIGKLKSDTSGEMGFR